MEEESFEQFAEVLIENCQNIADVRNQNISISSEKYVHLQNFVQFLVSNCYSKASIMCESHDIEEDQLFEFFLEYLCFFIHLTDRMAFSIIGDPERHVILDELGEFVMKLSIQTLFPELTEMESDDLFKNCMGHLNISSQEYIQYQELIPQDDEGSKGTLLWEFSKKMAELEGSGNNPGAIVGEYQALILTLQNIDINFFLERMK